jgi:hypothetical protein
MLPSMISAGSFETCRIPVNFLADMAGFQWLTPVGLFDQVKAITFDTKGESDGAYRELRLKSFTPGP